jgi:hypothetical protein
VLATDHVLVSKEDFPNARRRQRRQLRLVGEALAAGRNVAVDSTSPSPEEWQPLIELGRAYGTTTIGYWFPPDVPATVARNAVREGRARVPDVGLVATVKRLRRPRLADGFDRLYEVRFDGTGGFDVGSIREDD